MSHNYIDVVNKTGGKYTDEKERPIYCCFQDRDYPNIYWAIPTSSMENRSEEQIKRIKRYCALPNGDIRSCYYHIGYTNKPAIFKISNALPVTDEYISEYTLQGKHLILESNKIVSALERKLRRILVEEKVTPNKFEQHMTAIYDYLKNKK